MEAVQEEVLGFHLGEREMSYPEDKMTHPDDRRRRGMTAEEYIERYLDCRFLVQQSPKIKNLFKLAYRTGHRKYIVLLYRELRKMGLANLIHPDPFLPNMPPSGFLPPLSKDRIPLVNLTNADTLSLPIGKGGTDQHILVCGATGMGKTCLLRIIILAATGKAIVIVFDRKGDLENLQYASCDGEIIYLDIMEAAIAPFQKIQGMSDEEYIALLVSILAQSLNLIASRRLITEVLHILKNRKGKDIQDIDINRVIELIETIRTDPTSRLGQYKDATLYAFKDLVRRTGKVLTFASSTFFEEVFMWCRTFIFNMASIPPEHGGIIISLSIMREFFSRRLKKQSTPPVIICVDDAMNQIVGSAEKEAEGFINPLSNFIFLSRSFGIGMIFSAQNFSLVSPVIRGNCDTIIALGSSGRDAREIAEHMNLTERQKSVLPILRPGSAIVHAKSEWPLAVKGYFPYIEV